jgi:hypothetical protein
VYRMPDIPGKGPARSTGCGPRPGD